MAIWAGSGIVAPRPVLFFHQLPVGFFWISDLRWIGLGELRTIGVSFVNVSQRLAKKKRRNKSYKIKKIDLRSYSTGHAPRPPTAQPDP